MAEVLAQRLRPRQIPALVRWVPVWLRNLRTWADVEESTPETIVAVETAYTQQLIDAIASRDPAQARAAVASLVELPPEAIQAMRQTPVGEISVIPIPLPKQRM